MKKIFITSLILCFAFAKAYSQQLSGSEIIEKSIAYHDPNGNWSSFTGEFTVALETPDQPTRISTITLDLPKEYFNLTTEQDGQMSFREISKDTCKFTDESGKMVTTVTTTDPCERTRMYRDYYSYLYGLPMKLNDQGTNIHSEARKATFKGKEYLVVSVSYDEVVGSDIWQFYFDPTTYAMEVYQFFKGTDKTTGEYIMLSGLETVNEIKMPKNRVWYYNKNDGYLGTDKIINKH